MIFIQGSVPSSKNSRQWTGKFFIASEQTRRWRKLVKQDFINKKEEFQDLLKDKEKPYKIGFHFVRDSKRKYDFSNPLNTIQDEMVSYGWIEDDNVFEMIPFPMKLDGLYSTIDKNKPGVYIDVFP